MFWAKISSDLTLFEIVLQIHIGTVYNMCISMHNKPPTQLDSTVEADIRNRSIMSRQDLSFSFKFLRILRCFAELRDFCEACLIKTQTTFLSQSVEFRVKTIRHDLGNCWLPILLHKRSIVMHCFLGHDKHPEMKREVLWKFILKLNFLSHMSGLNTTFNLANSVCQTTKRSTCHHIKFVILNVSCPDL